MIIISVVAGCPPALSAPSTVEQILLDFYGSRLYSEKQRRSVKLNTLFLAALRRQKEEKMAKEYTMDTIVSLAKSRGFVYPGSEIYGGLANTWDYGNLGVELKK